MVSRLMRPRTGSSVRSLGALCDREYGFDDEGLRKRQALAWHPIVTPKGASEWVPNPDYQPTNLDLRRPRDYAELGFVHGHSRYEQAVRDLDRVGWVSSPALCAEVWKHFEP